MGEHKQNIRKIKIILTPPPHSETSCSHLPVSTPDPLKLSSNTSLRGLPFHVPSPLFGVVVGAAVEEAVV